MANTPTLTIRIPEDLRKQVAAAAKRDDRSLTSFVIHALREALYKTPAQQKWDEIKRQGELKRGKQ